MQFAAFLSKATKPFRRLLLLPMANCIGRAAALSGVPYLVKKIVDAAIGPDGQQLIFFATGIIAVEALNEVLSRSAEWAQMQYEPAMRNHITAFTLAELMRQPYSFLQNNKAGALIAHAGDLVMVPKLVSLTLFSVIQPLLGACIALVAAYSVQPLLALFLGIWTLLFCGIACYGALRIHPLASLSAAASAGVTGRLVDIVGHMREVRLGGASNAEMSDLVRDQKKYIAVNRQRRLVGLWINGAQGTSFFLYELISVFALIVWYQRGGISAGDFAFSLATNSALIFSLWHLGEAASNVADLWSGIERALAVLFAPHSLIEKQLPVALNASRGAITFESVTFGYGAGAPLFKKVSLDIPAGQKVGLVGYSGSGKTTFVQLMLRLYDLQGGRILIDGQDCALVTERSLREAISFVPQEPALFHRTIRENIAYARPEASMKEVVGAARQAAIHDIIESLPDGYETIVGERGARISGGQRQRIALARALLKSAPILILDEATSALDTLTEREVQLSLEEWFLSRGACRAQTTLVIAHRLSTLVAMDRILVFDHGVIVQDGTPEELGHQAGLYRKLWQAHRQEDRL